MPVLSLKNIHKKNSANNIIIAGIGFAGEKISSTKKEEDIIFDAVVKSMNDASLDFKKLKKEEIGLVLLTPNGALENYQNFQQSFKNNSPQPNFFKRALSSYPVSYVSLALSLRGPCFVLNEPMDKLALTLKYGFHLIKNGDCKVVISGGWQINKKILAIIFTLTDLKTLELYKKANAYN